MVSIKIDKVLAKLKNGKCKLARFFKLGKHHIIGEKGIYPLIIFLGVHRTKSEI